MDQLERNETALTVLITTSHNPSHFLRRVAKFLSILIPNSEKLTRGSLNFHELCNYCWNKEIKWLFILEDSENKKSAFLRFYDFNKSRSPINASIKLMNFNFPTKGDPSPRIEIKGIRLLFPDLEIKKIDKKVQEFLRTLKTAFISQINNSSLVIEFQKISSSHIFGIVTWEHNKKSIPVFSYEVKLPGGL